MKKVLSLALAIVLVLGLPIFAGCSANNAPKGDGWYYAADNRNEGGIEMGGPDSDQQVPGGFIENEFINVADEPISTFSADVDTASYSYFRKLVSQGLGINEIINYAGSSVRTEEMINYFKYDYTQPTNGELFGITAKAAPCPWNQDAVLFMLGLQAETAVNTSGNNLVFLIDVSGSMMSDDKLPLLKKAFTKLTEQLGEDDIVSIVTYSGQEKVVLDGCEGTKTTDILKAVNALKASGSTNGEAGLRMAYDIAKKHYITGGNNRIIMASDGDLNVGMSSAADLEEYVSEKRSEGIYISVLGFGTGNYRDANMEAIADNGNGIYYYIDGETEANKVFGTDLLGTLYTVAEDVKLQLTFDPEHVSSYRLVGYENRLLNNEDFEDDTKDAGEVGAGHSVTVCYELILTEGAMTDDGEWMKLAIRYRLPSDAESTLREYSIDRSVYTDAADDEFKFVCAVIETAMIIHRSPYIDELGIGDVLTLLSTLDLTSDQYKTEFADIVRTLVMRGSNG